MSNAIVIAATAAADLKPAPITPGWILSGTPQAQNKMLASSQDHSSYSMVWECTPGRFNWHYCEDETAVIIAGEVFITQGNGPECRLGPGNAAFFPAGSSCTWRITEKIKKVAVLRKSLPMPVALGLRVWNKLLRIVGMLGRPPLEGCVQSPPICEGNQINVALHATDACDPAYNIPTARG